MDAQRRTALIFVTQGVGCASCMCDWGINSGGHLEFNNKRHTVKLTSDTDFSRSHYPPPPKKIKYIFPVYNWYW